MRKKIYISEAENGFVVETLEGGRRFNVFTTKEEVVEFVQQELNGDND